MKFNKCYVWVLVRWGLRKGSNISKFICGSLHEELERIVVYDNSEFSSNGCRVLWFGGMTDLFVVCFVHYFTTV